MQNLENSDALLSLFFIMHTFGWICSSILLVIALLPSGITRHYTWINLSISWIIACFGFSFLLLSGQVTRPKPNPGVCLFQAGLVYSGPPLTAGATLSLAIHLWRTICAKVDYSKLVLQRRNFLVDLMLVVWPYFGAVSMFIGVLAVGIQRRDLVVLGSSRMYCGLDDPIPGKISAIYVAILTVIAILLEVYVVFFLYRAYRSNGGKRSTQELSIIYRLVAFSFFGIFPLSISLTYLSSRSYGRLPNVLMALTPVSFVLIFGTQMDIVRTLAFWRATPLPLNGLKPSKPIEFTSVLITTSSSTTMGTKEGTLVGGDTPPTPPPKPPFQVL